jgi:glyoxylase-like metal-dependent hydrolase (beta-lactamase superfamily II)
VTVHRVPITYDAAPGGSVNAYLVVEEHTVLVDAPERHPDLDALLNEHGLDAVVATHHHPDHAAGIGTYARDYDATAYCRTGRATAFADATGIEPDETFRAGSHVADTLTVLDTPGHVPEHVAFRCADGLVTGDLAVADGSVAVTAPEGDLRAYLASLRRVRALAPDRLFPGHGPVIDDPRATCTRLLRHRLDRERRVLAAVEAGARTLDEVTEAAYEKDVSTVWAMAVDTVEAHVEKLAVEGRVARDGERVTPA